MADIVLTTLNARWQHAAFGLRSLLANMGDLRERTTLLEFGINQHTVEILDALLTEQPRIIGLGVYIWNVEQCTRLAAELKRVRPDVLLILGGPEVSYESESQEIVRLADYTITGEGDLTLLQVCRQLLDGERPVEKIIPAKLPRYDRLQLPYDLYTDEDIAHRVIYVEASRGCPFTCEFCLSALDIPVRQAPLEEFLAAMQSLLDRGTRQFKFVDRTFNLNPRISIAILQFFLERYRPGLFLHFEMIPDRLPESLREWIVRFPPGVLQFEVGVQTLDPEVCERISRRQDNDKLAENLRFLREETGVHVHADLIVGLPGESIESFAAGFDRLVAMGPQEIQVGMLKRLRGTPIIRHDDEWQMVYSPHPPYEILQNRLIDFPTMQRLRRFARCWDLVGNSGNFVESAPLLWSGDSRFDSPFAAMVELSERLYQRIGRGHGIALGDLAAFLFEHLTAVCGHDARELAPVMWRDYRRGGRRDRPKFLRRFDLDGAPEAGSQQNTNSVALPSRQSRHVQS